MIYYGVKHIISPKPPDNEKSNLIEVLIVTPNGSLTMAKKKIKRRKGRNDADAKRKEHAKVEKWKELKKKHITPEYCRAAIANLTEMLDDKTRWESPDN